MVNADERSLGSQPQYGVVVEENFYVPGRRCR
jgi:hypothetical protein